MWCHNCLVISAKQKWGVIIGYFAGTVRQVAYSVARLCVYHIQSWINVVHVKCTLQRTFGENHLATHKNDRMVAVCSGSSCERVLRGVGAPVRMPSL